LDKKTSALIIKQLRVASLRCAARNEAVKNAKVFNPKYKNNGELSKAYRVSYVCNICKKNQFTQKEIKIDHIVAVGRFQWDWNSYINRLFCSSDKLQAICKPCHDNKTKKDIVKIKAQK